MNKNKVIKVKSLFKFCSIYFRYFFYYLKTIKFSFFLYHYKTTNTKFIGIKKA